MHDLEHGETVVEREKFLKLVVPAAQRLLRSGQYGHVEWSLEQRAIFDHLGDGCPGRVDGVGDRFDLLLQSLALGGDGVEMRKLRLEMGLERSEEHTSELQSLMRISYAVFCLKKKTIEYYNIHYIVVHNH